MKTPNKSRFLVRRFSNYQEKIARFLISDPVFQEMAADYEACSLQIRRLLGSKVTDGTELKEYRNIRSELENEIYQHLKS